MTPQEVAECIEAGRRAFLEDMKRRQMEREMSEVNDMEWQRACARWNRKHKEKTK